MTKIDAYLHSTTPILPPQFRPQQELINWILAAYQESFRLQQRDPKTHLLKRFAVGQEQISQRYIECPDITSDWPHHEIYHLSPQHPQGADILKRNQFFSERAALRIGEAYQERSHPQQFIHVTCTGYMSPSAPQHYFSTFKKAPAITHAYHMGCYASLPSIRLASALAKQNEDEVDIFHNEMCSLHMNLAHPTPEQMVVQSLFADGHIVYRVSKEKKGFKILGVKEKIIPDSLNDMSWTPSPQTMLMNLSRKVPAKIKDHIKDFVCEMLSEFGRNPACIGEAVFAIHPGGPKIIEVVKDELELRDQQIIESRKILFERGNMSSATLPHVWHEILNNNYPSGTPIISLAFGPGLTVFGSVFEVV